MLQSRDKGKSRNSVREQWVFKVFLNRNILGPKNILRVKSVNYSAEVAADENPYSPNQIIQVTLSFIIS